MFQADERTGDSLGFAGDFKWTSPDGKDEAVLRLQKGGKWWHAAHSQRAAKPATADWLDFRCYFEDEEEEQLVWDLAESLGSWQVEPIFRGDGDIPDGVGIVLQCETCRWASGDPHGPDTTSRLRADAGYGLDVDNMVRLGQVSLCFAMRWCQVTGSAHLVLDTTSGDTGYSESFRAAVKGLGFARTYRRQPDDRERRRCSQATHDHTETSSDGPGSDQAEDDGWSNWPTGNSAAGDAAGIARSYLQSVAGPADDEDGTSRAESSCQDVNTDNKRYYTLTLSPEPPAIVHKEEDLAQPLKPALEVVPKAKSDGNPFGLSELEGDLPYGSLDGSS